MTEAGGLIIAAIIAGAVTFFSLIVSKEQSISEFRQEWVNALRRDIAIIVSCVIGIHGESITGDDEQDLWDRVKSDFTRFNRVIVRIKLRLNPDEKRKGEKEATKAVVEALEELETVFSRSQPQFHRLDELIEKLVTNSQTILKTNWDRVRAGEPIYQVTKWTALIITFGGLGYGLYRLSCNGFSGLLCH